MQNHAAVGLLQDFMVHLTPALTETLVGDGMSQGEVAAGIMRAARGAAIRRLRRPPPSSASSQTGYAGKDDECEQKRMHVLDALLQLYSSHPSNYAVVEPRYHLLSLFLTALTAYDSSEVKEMVLKTLEYVALTLNVPELAIQAASLTFLAMSEAVSD